MGGDERRGDWAAWMGTPAPVSSRAPAGQAAAAPVVAEPRSMASPDGAPADATAPVAAPPAGTDRPYEDSGAAADREPEPSGDRVRSPRREATRQRVLDAAREVFAELGIFGGTVEDICERAGFTRGAFYSNFADKDDVVDALVGREHDRLIEHLESSFALVDREIAETPDLGAALASIVEQVLRSIPIDRQLVLGQAELEIFAVRRPDLGARFVESNNRFRARIGAFIETAMSRHARELTLDTSIVVDAMVAIVERSVRRALLPGGNADPDAMASAVLPGLLLAFSRPVPTV
jgi:AcrR family transcriptional regulator